MDRGNSIQKYPNAVGRLQKLTLVLICGGVLLGAPSSSLAADADFWIGMSGVQATSNNQGVTRFVQVVVGTNEQGVVPAWTVAVVLQVKGPGGFSCGAVGGLPARRYKPAVPMPVRFQILYPPSPPPTPRMSVSQRLASPKYTLTASITSITPAPSGDSIGNNKNEFTYDFPPGGTPLCVNTLDPPPGVTFTANPSSPGRTGTISFQARLFVPGNTSGLIHKFQFSYNPPTAPYDAAQTGSLTVELPQALTAWYPNPQPLPGVYNVAVNIKRRRASDHVVVDTWSKQITNYVVTSDPAYPFGWYFPITTQNTTEPVGPKIGNAEDAIAGQTIKAIVNDPNVRVRANNTSCVQCHSQVPQNLMSARVPNFAANQGQHASDTVLKNLFNNWRSRNCPN